MSSELVKREGQVVPWESVIRAFLDSQKTESTRRTYEPTIRAMAEKMGGTGPLEVGADMVTTWARGVRDRVEKGEIAPNTGRRRLMTVKSFFRFANANHQSTLDAERRKIALQSPAGGVVKPFKILNDAEEGALLDALSDNHRPVVATMLYAGLRVSETCKLLQSDYYGDERGQRWLQVRGKGGETRKVPVGDTLASHLGDPVSGDAPLFKSRQGDGHYSRSRLFQIVKEAIEKAGVGRRISPHSLRHTAAVRWLMVDGVPINVVQKWLGHSSLASTQIYLDHVAEIESHGYMK